MRVEQAREAARRWVLEEAGAIPDLVGAFTHGSVNWLADDAILPPTSDVDILLVLAGTDPPAKPGKFIYRDVMLEVSYLPAGEIESPERILGAYHLAGSFRRAAILADPGGRLARLQAAVARDYAKRPWVLARCEHARDKVLRNLRGVNEWPLFHDQVMAWAFAAGVTTHVLLVAGLCNPTVRQRYLAVRTLLAAYGRTDFYPELLALLGCAHMSRTEAEGHLAALAEVFDVAKRFKAPFPFASDISDGARAVAIDGSREMIERGDHREAVCWVVATYSRCLKVLHHSEPGLQQRFLPGYGRLLADLGIGSADDLQPRSAQIEAFLPRLWAVAEEIVAANPDVEDAPGPQK